MTESPLRLYGDKILRQKIEDVIFPRDDLKQIVMSMLLIMYKEGGVGLAANQVGISERIAVIDVKQEQNDEDQVILINPTIIKSEGEVDGNEGCLSLPGIHTPKKRAQYVEVESYTYDGEKVIIKGEDLLAVALQHEIDHLNGKLFIDDMPFIQHNMLATKLKRLARQNKKERRK